MRAVVLLSGGIDSPVAAYLIHRALKIILGINYNFKWIDLEISPMSTTWYTAVQFRNDPQRRWNPRIMVFYPSIQKVVILEKIGGEPRGVDASTIITMAETRAQSPDPKLS